jgi:DNA polymerase-3 subunit gamma/tau
VYKIDPSSLREEIGDQARGALDELAPAIDAQRLLRLIEKVSEVESTMKWASNKKLHLEIALIRAIQTLSEVSLGAVIDALANLRDGSDQPAQAVIAPTPSTPSPQGVTKPGGSPQAVVESSPPAKPAPDLSLRESLEQSEPISTPEPSIDSLWPRLLQVVSSRRPLILSWIELATPTLLGNGTFRLTFPKDQQLAAESLSRPNNRRLLEDILSELLGGSSRLEFETREETSPPSAAVPEDKPIDPLQSFKSDPMIQKALEIFKAEIQSDR